MILSIKDLKRIVGNYHPDWNVISVSDKIYVHIKTERYYFFEPFHGFDYQPIEVEKRIVEVEKWVPKKIDKSEAIDDLITLLDETRHVYCGICKKAISGDLHRLDLPDSSHVLICLKCKEKNDEMS